MLFSLTFSQVDWGHYVQLGPIVERTCQEFGVPYVKLPTIWDAFRSHVSHIRSLNHRPRGSWSAIKQNRVEMRKLPKYPPVWDATAASEVSTHNVEGLALMGQLHSYHFH